MVRIKVMHILEATAGGTRRYLEDMVHSGALDSFDCAFIYSTLGSDQQFYSLLQELNRRQWNLYDVPMKRNFDIYSYLRSVFGIRRAILDFQPDVIHCHSSFAGAFGRLACYFIKLSKRPKIVYTPNALPIHLGKHFEYIERLFAKFTDLFISISDSENQEIVQHCKVSPNRVSTVWPSIDCSYYSPISLESARVPLGLSPDEKVIVGMGRLCEQKDPLSFFEIYRRLKIDYPTLRAIWIGDGELLDRMKELQTEFALDRILITGWVRDVRPFIAAANVVVVPSRYESFGYVTAEAQAAEKPVVATRVNGTVDIIKIARLAIFMMKEIFLMLSVKSGLSCVMKKKKRKWVERDEG
jgi:glycosyltransferase involved in cell wall biosynthesis